MQSHVLHERMESPPITHMVSLQDSRPRQELAKSKSEQSHNCKETENKKSVNGFFLQQNMESMVMLLMQNSYMCIRFCHLL